MVKYKQFPTPHQQSVKVRAKPLKGPSIEVPDFGDESGLRISCSDNKHDSKKSNAQSSEMLSTAELISAVGQLWDCASRSLTNFQPRPGSDCIGTLRQRENGICYLAEDDNIVAVDVINSESLHVQLDSRGYFPSIVQRSLKCFRTQKFHYMPCEDQYIQNFLRGIRYDMSSKNHTWLKEKGLADVEISYSLIKKDRYLTQINPLEEHPMSTSSETEKIPQSFMPEAAVSVRGLLSRNEQNFSSCSGTNFGPCIDTSNRNGLYSSGNLVDIVYRMPSMSVLYSGYLLQIVQNTHNPDALCTALSLGMKSHASISDPSCNLEANHQESEADGLVENEMVQCEEPNVEREIQSASSLRLMCRPHPLLAKQEHAVSGALSGIVVSLCLHPLDTVKTVLQSCQAGQKSLRCIGQSIITERGLSGLYRGISSNITTSAPISAIYTFTYESVKGFLLPSLTKEYHSVAHCTAGACASIATSFIFTPSEHIKQQMQVNTKYQNCWHAAFKIIEKGGLLSLYAGWGAVLCRNIPHSIIKFYTYESLKQMFISELPTSRPRTLETLLCGGLAGSAAALFSTPFDVVKTRLQTQMPGSARRYHNILSALQHIRAHEGVKGLYRGLIPRLAMYMTQGALFFASYEFFQGLLSLDLRHDKSEMTQYKQDTDDDTLLQV